MNLFRKAAQFFVQRLSPRSPDGWTPAPETAGESVTESSVLAISAVWACVNIIAGTQATLPCMVYRINAKGEREVAKDHPLYRLLHDSPNADQTAVDFWESMALAVELWGNAYALIERGAQGRLVAITPIRPDIVTVSRRKNGGLIYEWTDDGKRFEAAEDRILHVRGFGGGPLGGLSTIAYGRRTFGLAQALNKSASASFGNGMRPSGALMFKEFLTNEQRQIAQEKLTEKYAGAANSGRPMVLEGGAEFKPFSMDHKDAQLLESRAFSVEDVCRMFGVPPFMVGYTEKSTSWGTGIEQQTIGFVKFSLRRRLKRFEQAIEKQVLAPAERAAGVTVEFNIEGLLRGDSAARSQFYQTMTNIGAMTINEVRGLENLPPVDGGDVPRMQMQNVPITEAGMQNTPPVAA